MSIQQEDIKYFKSAVFNDTAANGGGMSTNESVSGVSGNIFPTVSQAERTAGSTKYRKIFVANREATSLTLFNSKLFIENPTPADDIVVVFPGTLIDDQGDLTGTERVYGCGWLATGVNAGVTQIVVAVEDGTIEVFQNGDTVRISDKANVNDPDNNEEYVTITNVTYAGDEATIDFTPALVNSYSSAGQATRVASLIDLADIETSVTGFVVTSASGTYDDTANPVVTDNQGTIRQNWTLTFTSTSAFNVVGDTLGNIGTGSLAGGSSPANPITGTPYFTLEAGGFGGAWAVGETITFSTIPAAKSVWFKRIVPAGTPSYAANKFVSVVEGESE